MPQRGGDVEAGVMIAEANLPEQARMGATKQRLVINVSSNVVYLLLTSIFGLWFTPYLLKHLGVAAYGFVPLSASVTAYMSVLTTALNSSVGRFLTIDLVKRDWPAANRTFSTSIVGALLLFATLLPVVFGLAIAAPYVFDVPAELDADVSWLFLMVGLSFLVAVIGSCVSVPSFSYNRFDLQNLVKTVRLIVLVGATLALFSLSTAGLTEVGLATLVAAIVSFGGYVWLWRRLAPSLAFRLADFDRLQFRALGAMGGWVVVNQIGAMLFLNIDLVVVNLVFGAESAGRYGSVLQLSVMLRTLATTIAAVLAPIVIAKFARDDVAGMVRVSRQSIKFMGLGMALPVGLLCGLARPVLEMWLGSSFGNLDVLLIVLVAPLGLNLAVLPLFQIQVSANKVRWPGIVSLAMGLLNVLLAFVWALYGSWGAIGVAAASAVALTAKNVLYTPVYNAIILNLRWWKFLPVLVSSVVATVAVALASYGLGHLVKLAPLQQLAVTVIVVSVAYAAIVYTLVLDRQDRQLLRGANILRRRA